MPTAGTILNFRYRLDHKLGKGGFSEVWHAWDLKTNQEVALKIFHRQDDEGLKLCEKEFNRTNGMFHARLIRLLDFNVHEHAPYLVMPYYHRGTPEIKAGELSEEAIWRIMHDIGRALDYIHNLNPPMIHNDLKPDNFLIADDGSYVLADFGISTELADKLTRSRDLSSIATTGEEDENRPAGVAPRAYRAPELFHYRDIKKRPAVKASDIWSFGVCLYELASGDPPFGDQGGFFQLTQYRDEKTPIRELVEGNFPRHFSPMLADSIFKCLEFETWDRPQAKSLAAKAEQRLYIAPPSVAPPRPANPAPPPARPPQPAPAPPPKVQERQQASNFQQMPNYQRQSVKPVHQRRALAGWGWGLASVLLLSGGGYAARNYIFRQDGLVAYETPAAVVEPQPPPPVTLHKQTTTSKKAKPQESLEEEPIVMSAPSSRPAYKKSQERPASPTPTPQNSNIKSSPYVIETIGVRSSGRGYHLVVPALFTEDKARRLVNELNREYPDQNTWATHKSWDNYELKIGSFPTQEDAKSFQTMISKLIGSSTAFYIRRN